MRTIDRVKIAQRNGMQLGEFIVAERKRQNKRIAFEFRTLQRYGKLWREAENDSEN